jgi:hypothetical protein
MTGRTIDSNERRYPGICGVTVALSLIWSGAARMPTSAKSRYATASVLSAVLIGWLAVAQYLGEAANTGTTLPMALP